MKSILFSLLTLFLINPVYSSVKLPVEKFASLPDVSGLKISPDGMHIASLVNIDLDKGKGTAVLLRNLETQKLQYLAQTDNKRFLINWLRWANNSTLLISTDFPTTRNGTPTTETRLLKVDIHNGDIGSILPPRYIEKFHHEPQFQDNIVDILADDPNHLLLSLRLSNTVGTQVVRVRVDSKKNPRKIQNIKEHVFSWRTDRQHRIRIAIKYKGTKNTIFTKDLDQDDWRVLWEYESLSEDVITPMGFDFNPNILYYRAYHNDHLSVFKVDITDSNLKGELVYSDEDYDVNGSLLYSDKNKKVVGVRSSSEGGYTFWDEDYLIMQQSLDKALPNTDNVFYSMSEDENRLVVLSTSDVDSGTYFIWDRKQHSLKSLAFRYKGLDPENMIEKEKISYQARDDLEIEGYLTRPNKNGPQPTIIFPHGGPIGHNGRGFDYWTQFFANRGYTVLQMNFRGSSGYGFDFMQSGLKNWGLNMQTDVEDGTRWLIKEKIADADNICIVGASYGGYAALMEAANNSDLYQCVVSFAGVTDLPYLVKSYTWFTNYEVVKKQIGSDKESLSERSPVNRASEITIPVLLVHGSKDRTVRVQHSKKMRDKLKKAKKDFKYIEQKDGDHYLSNQQHRIQLFREMDEFLNANLH